MCTFLISAFMARDYHMWVVVSVARRKNRGGARCIMTAGFHGMQPALPSLPLEDPLS